MSFANALKLLALFMTRRIISSANKPKDNGSRIEIMKSRSPLGLLREDIKAASERT